MADDIEKRIDFIIEHQAKFAADLQMFEEHQAKFAAQIQEQFQKIEERQEVNTRMIGQLADVSLSLAHHMEGLTEAQTRTEYRLNALIDTVDKLVRRNGDSSKA